MKVYIVAIADVESYIPIELTHNDDKTQFQFEEDVKDALQSVALMLIKKSPRGMIDSCDFMSYWDSPVIRYLRETKGYKLPDTVKMVIPNTILGFSVANGRPRNEDDLEWVSLLGEELFSQVEQCNVNYENDSRSRFEEHGK